MNMIHITYLINKVIKFDNYDKFIGSTCHYFDQIRDLILKTYGGYIVPIFLSWASTDNV
jgi:hypothetical protein